MLIDVKILFFFPHNIENPSSGAHLRAYELLSALRLLGHEVIFFSGENCSEIPWTKEAISALESNLVSKVELYQSDSVDTILRSFAKHSRSRPPLFVPPGMKRAFDKTLHTVQPDAVFMSYRYWDKLLEGNRDSFKTVVDTHAIFSLNDQMAELVSDRLPPRPLQKESFTPELRRLDFFSHFTLTPDPKELADYNRYSSTIAITKGEAEMLEKKCPNTKVCYIPATHPIVPLANSYAGNAFFPTGPNVFNLQGYVFFVEEVIPLIKRNAESFMLSVSGSACKDLYPAPGVELCGFIPSIKEAYEQAPFLVCPVFGGGGQQVKVIEAMAHGVAPIVCRHEGEKSPIIHGENGLIADSAEEFAAHCSLLWNDRALCRKMGTAARETIRSGFSREKLCELLPSALN